MTTTPDGLTFDDRDRRIWQIQHILSRVRPDDMTDAELEAAIAIFRLAEAGLPGNKPMLRIDGTGSPLASGSGAPLRLARPSTLLRHTDTPMDVFTCQHCDAVSELVVDGRVHL